MLRSLRPYGELDIKLKNKNVFKSFRFEIVLYSILSLFYTIITEALIYCLLFYVKNLLDGIKSADRGQSLFEQLADMPIQNGTSFVDGSSSTGLTYSLSKVLMINRDYLVITMILALLVGMILFILYFLLLTKRFSNYLYEITDGIQQIAEGDFSTTIRVCNEDEFAVIAKSINKMSDDIKKMMDNDRQNEKMKHDLVTNVAHDLRTPLTSIIGYLDLAKEETLDKETKERYIRIAYEKSKRLEHLIEDLFSYTKFTSGEVNVEKHQLDYVKLIEQMVEEFYPSFYENQLEYDYTANTTSCFICADGNLLARAIGNLLSNAVKYGKDGKKIRICLREQEKRVILRITNYGSIIPEKELKNVFDKFYRVENSRSIGTGGTGLGLAITKSIILLHDGTITVNSNYEGTVFEVILPTVKIEEEEKGEGSL